MSLAVHLAGISEERRSRDQAGAREEVIGGGIPDLSIDAIQIDSFFQGIASTEELHLVQRLFFLPHREGSQAIVFCGVGAEDGTGYVCARAAEILASQVRKPVCLMDANLKAPTVHRRYDLEGAASFRGRKERPDRENPAPPPQRNLWVLPASAIRQSCPELTPDQIRDRLSRLRERFGYLLICAPPLEVTPDGFLLGQMCDGVVLVLQACSTQRALAGKVRHNLEVYGVPLLGAVLNELPQPKSRSLWKTLFERKLGRDREVDA